MSLTLLHLFSGHIRNIHFPFDIEEDTSIAVASEMVEELELTDHDVSVIAAIIDSEFQSLVPDWSPRELTNEDRETIAEMGESGAHKDTSPTANDSAAHSGHLVLERLPSGRKYWSDSPKASGVGGCSPHRPGPSHLMSVDSTLSGDTWSEVTSHSPFSHKDISISHDASPYRHVECDSDHEDDRKQEPSSSPSEAQFDETDQLTDAPGSEPHPLEESEMGDIKSIVKKLDHVMDEQLKELSELRLKHKVAVLDLLKDLPQENRQRVLSMFNEKLHGTN